MNPEQKINNSLEKTTINKLTQEENSVEIFDVEDIQENSWERYVKDKSNEINQKLLKGKIINDDGTENEEYFKLRSELKILNMFNSYEEIICTEDIPLYKSIYEIVKNHYGEKLIPIEITKESYSIREIIDLGWIGDLKLEDFNSYTHREIDYNYDVGFDNYVNFDYYKTFNKDETVKKIIRISKEADSRVEELSVYYDGIRLRFEDITKNLINIDSIQKEILDLIPRDFGKYEFDAVSPYSNSLYFINNQGAVCRISDHRLDSGYNQYPSNMVYSILIDQPKEKNNIETTN